MLRYRTIMSDLQALAEDIKADDDKGFIFEMARNWMFDPDLKAEYPEVDVWILIELSNLVEDGKVSNDTAERVFNKLYPLLRKLSK